ncbi:thioredoxin family protein [Stieleria varia]|uniref:Thioredoxin n=1 Tax=Stieleria varia TaxID=2528005 RepID=A0A5C6B2H1_9BACT|nr:thioredoxin family protein [Stieleria varia]TWU06128.1 Thioredoxin [Stieleria varia]
MKMTVVHCLLVLCSSAVLLAACQAGEEAPFAAAESSDVSTDARHGGSVGTRVNNRYHAARNGDVLLTTATANAHSQGPTLITLGAGDDLRRHLNGSHRRVILDFYADWCGPCKQQGRVLHEIEHVAADANALIIKINVDQHKDLAEIFSVKALPTVMVYGRRTILQRRTGLTSAEVLTSWVH